MCAERLLVRFTLIWALSPCVSCAQPPHIDIPLTPPSQLCPDTNGICVPAARLEHTLERGYFDILAWRSTAHGVSGALTLWLSFAAEQLVLRAKWKAAPHNGSGFDNDARKEIAAYRLQQLFLDPAEYVVPPTVARCIPTHFYHRRIGHARSTFAHTSCVLGVLAYWLEGVHELGPIDHRRFEKDPTYRTAIANLNLFTYLFNHRDSRPSNFVMADRDTPRAFAVDNGLALSGITNPRTTLLHEWQHLRVHKLPHTTIERLRKLTRQDLDTLATVVEFRVVDRQLEPVPPTPPLDDNQGVRHSGDVVQLGLTHSEIDGIASRLKSLLARIDAHELEEY
jgi:hypothetical protein